MKKLGLVLMMILAVSVCCIAFPDMSTETQEQVVAKESSVLERIDFDSIITWVVTILGTIFAGAFSFVRTKLKKIIVLVKEFYEVLEATNEAIEDDNLTRDELKKIKKEIADFTAAFKALTKPEKK